MKSRIKGTEWSDSRVWLSSRHGLSLDICSTFRYSIFPPKNCIAFRIVEETAKLYFQSVSCVMAIERAES